MANPLNFDENSPIRPLWNHVCNQVLGLLLFALMKPVFWFSFWIGEEVHHPTPTFVQSFLEYADDGMLVYFVLLIGFHFVVATWPFGKKHNER